MVMSHWTSHFLSSCRWLHVFNQWQENSGEATYYPPACAEKPDFVWKSGDCPSGSLQDMDKAVFVWKSEDCTSRSLQDMDKAVFSLKIARLYVVDH
jgi:hypothetical protein